VTNQEISEFVFFFGEDELLFVWHIEMNFWNKNSAFWWHARTRV